ncbi:hypothetical protein [Microtetraspora niveoalba]|uniref:hypothetical protein n=1 Tax=Microtetraspora niveoalba TaxID=46175 RepID=UPI00082D666A|nr:hypothetical protein [Microtetraspora niveoalba]
MRIPTSSPRIPGFRRTLAALAAVLLVPAGGCASESDRAMCGVVVDSTGFAEYATAKDLIRRHLGGFADGCDWVGLAAITGNSVGTPCQVASLRLYASDRENPNRNPKIEEAVRAEKLKQVGAGAEKLLTCQDDPSGGSDVLGGLRAVGDRMKSAPKPDRDREIVVFSDLMSNVGVLDLNESDYGEEQVRKDKVRELREKHLLPDLADTAVAVHGFNLLSERDPDRVPQLRLLWTEIFTAAGVRELTID